MEKLGIAPTDIEFRENILYDLDAHDFMLLDKSSDLKEKCKALRKVKPCDIGDFVSAELLSSEIDWIQGKYIDNDHEAMEPVYIPNDNIIAYIENAVDNIINRLSNGRDFPRMF